MQHSLGYNTTMYMKKKFPNVCRMVGLCMHSHTIIFGFHFHINSTTENLTIFIWDQLKKALDEKSDLLYEVLIHETDNNTFFYRGE